MQYKRWYDDYNDLKSLLDLLEKLTPNQVEAISEDFLQIIMNRNKSRLDEVIKTLSDNAPPRYSRWYDKNYNLHTWIEFIRISNDNERKEIINSFIMSLLNYVASVDNE